MVEEHGAEMSSRDKRDARRVQADFEFEEVGVGRRGGRRDRDREHNQEREPPPHLHPPSAPARPPGVGRRREGFGAGLTVNDPNVSVTNTPPAQSRRATPSPSRGDVDPEVLEWVFFGRYEIVSDFFLL